MKSLSGRDLARLVERLATVTDQRQPSHLRQSQNRGAPFHSDTRKSTAEDRSITTFGETGRKFRMTSWKRGSAAAASRPKAVPPIRQDGTSSTDAHNDLHVAEALERRAETFRGLNVRFAYFRAP